MVALAAVTLASAAVCDGFARLELLQGLIQDLLVDDFIFFVDVGEPFDLRLPALHGGGILSHIGLGLLDLGGRHLRVVFGDLHKLLGNIDHDLVQFDLGLGSLVLGLQLGDINRGQDLILVNLSPISTFHFSR